MYFIAHAVDNDDSVQEGLTSEDVTKVLFQLDTRVKLELDILPRLEI
jgi:hypothetical protein